MAAKNPIRHEFPPRRILLRSQLQVDTVIALVKNVPLDPDNPIEVLFREQPKARGNDANSYYWMRLGEIAEQAWVHGKQFNSDSWHEYCKRHIMPNEITTKAGDRVSKWLESPDGTMTITSTTALEKRCFAEYIDQVEAFGAGLGVQFSARPQKD